MTGTEPSYQLRELKIEVTQKCPLACIHCSSDALPSSSVELDRDKCLEVLREAADMGVQEVTFSGGEPLAWLHTQEAVGCAASLGFDVSLYTSGCVDNVSPAFKTLRGKGLNRLVFSIFGADPQTHESITRVKGSLNATIRAIDAAAGQAIDTELHFVPLRSNYRSLRAVANLGKQLGVPRMSVLRFVPQGRGSLLADASLTRMQNLELKKAIQALRAEGYKIRTGSPYNFLMVSDRPTCSAGCDRLIVGPNLRIHPCDAFKQIDAEDIVGDDPFSSLGQASLQECWERSRYLALIREHLATGFDDPCDSCTCLEKCLSGCLAQKVIAAGALTKGPDPQCLLSKWRST